MHIIKKYWFRLLMSIFLLGAISYFIVVFISPRYDVRQRGFVPCTMDLATNVENCGPDNILCILHAIGTDNICNLQVIIQGGKNWLNGKQNTPWENYIYEPELPPTNTEDNPELQDFYQENPNLIQDMQDLKKLNKEQETDE